MEHVAHPANEQLKKRARTWVWVGLAAAAAIHAGVLFLTPPMTVDVSGVSSDGVRLIVVVGELAPPARVDAEGFGTSDFVPADEVSTVPRVLNAKELLSVLPRVYPPVLWEAQEEARARVQLWIDRVGRVRHALLLEEGMPATDEAILELARRLRFGPGIRDGSRVGVVGQLEISIEWPL